MHVVLADDRFEVTYDAQRVTVNAMLDVIRRLEYEPVVVERTSNAPSNAPTRVGIAALPAALVRLFAEARDADKPVLLRFSGPG